jgi:molecular chaperone DnaJ
VAQDNTDFYALLGVARTASDDEIKRAYRAKAREFHPDANPGNAEAEEKFKQVSIAYEVLKDPDKRRQYDQFGIDGIRGMGGGGGGDPFGFGAGGFADLFEAFFGGGGSPFGGGGRRGQAGPPRGGDLEATMDLPFVEAVFGTTHELEVRLPVACDACSGSGAAPGTSASTCPDCQGAGELRRIRQSLLGQMVTSSPCGRCGASGQIVESPCTTCRGEGRRTEARSYKVDVPAGVDHGTTLRLTNKGAAGVRGGGNGDLYVHLRVASHPRFERNGYDLIERLEVPFTQATLGAGLKYETLDGTEDLVIAPGTQSGKVFRLRGRGVPHVNGRGGRGDLLVQVAVVTPSRLSKEEEDLLRQLAAIRGEDVAPPDNSWLKRIRSAFK